MSLNLTRIFHAGWIVESCSAKIFFDPILENPFSFNCHVFPEVELDLNKFNSKNTDAIVISHIHDDHFSLTSLNFFERDIPVYIYTTNTQALDLIKDLGFQQIHALNHRHPIHIKDICITAYPALDEDIDCLLHIQHENQNILNVVDSWINWPVIDELKSISWDLIIWPFQTMREFDSLKPQQAPEPDLEIPIEWQEQLKILNPKNLIAGACQFKFEPFSWLNNFFFPISHQSFQETIKRILPESALFQIAPSSCLNLTTLKITTNNLEWIKTINPNLSDYSYEKNQYIPTQKEYSKNFKPLTEDKKEKIFQWLENDLEQLFNNLTFINDKDEEVQIHWSLLIYEENKTLKEITLTSKPKLKSYVIQNWTTEVIAKKLYQALRESATLTSLNPRINDTQKDESTLDILQDPLLQILYNKDPLSYQKSQLKRITQA